MATLPQLIEEDVRRLDEALDEFSRQTEGTAALIIDKGGFLLAHQGEADRLDLTSIGALAAGAFMANQSIAGLLDEKKFDTLHQQGENLSLFVSDVDEHCLLVVIFKSASGIGVVKYYAAGVVQKIAAQLAVADARGSGGGLDLSALNCANPQEFFRKKTA